MLDRGTGKEVLLEILCDRLNGENIADEYGYTAYEHFHRGWKLDKFLAVSVRLLDTIM